LRGDLLAGVTVTVVALPLALAFGVASGAGAVAGLITAVVAGAVAAVFGGSDLQVSGPTGAMTVVLAPIVAEHGIGAVGAVALLAGLVVVLAGVLRLGRMVNHLPWPVVEGFTLGIAVVIAAQQVPLALDVPRPAGENALLVAWRSVTAFAADPQPWPPALLALSILLMSGVTRVRRSLPASLVAVLVVTVVAELADADVTRIGHLPSKLPVPGLPPLDGLPSLVGPALVVAALAALESLLSARVADGMADTRRHDPDRELLGQGLANIACSLFGGLPATGALARTAVNARSGACTRLAALVHALGLLVVMLVAARLVGRIPLVVLAGVLLVTAWRMVDRPTVRAVVRSTRPDATVFLLTAGVTLAVDLVTAVEVGLLSAGAMALVKLAETSQLVEDVDVSLGDTDEHDLLRRHVLVYRLDGPLFFAAATRFLHELTTVSDVRVVVLRLGNLALLDASGARAVAEIVDQLDRRGIVIILKVADPLHIRLLRTVGALTRLEEQGHTFSELADALAHARKHALEEGRPAPR
jgi:SulP family sulfate permease